MFGFFKKKIGSSLTGEADSKTLQAIKLFTRSAFPILPASDYAENKGVLVFLFGAFDAVAQGNKIDGQAKFDMLEAYLINTFPAMLPNDIEATVTFLCEAASDPVWIPFMDRGGQTFVDFSRGDFLAPTRNITPILLGIGIDFPGE